LSEVLVFGGNVGVFHGCRSSLCSSTIGQGRGFVEFQFEISGGVGISDHGGAAGNDAEDDDDQGGRGFG
jgi:hypothetical protein